MQICIMETHLYDFCIYRSAYIGNPGLKKRNVPHEYRLHSNPVRAMPAATTSLMPLATLAIGFVIAMLDVTVVNVALPGIAAQFGVPLTDLVWIADAYTLAFAALLLAAGAGRPLRGQDHLPGGTGRVHAGLVAVRHGARQPR